MRPVKVEEIHGRVAASSSIEALARRRQGLQDFAESDVPNKTPYWIVRTVLRAAGVGAEGIHVRAARVVLSLWSDDLAELKTKAFQGSELFGVEETTDSQFHVNPHARLGGLRRGQLVYALFDEVFVDGFRVECLIESDICFADAAVCELTFFAGLLGEDANPLTLLGCQV